MKIFLLVGLALVGFMHCAKPKEVDCALTQESLSDWFRVTHLLPVGATMASVTVGAQPEGWTFTSTKNIPNEVVDIASRSLLTGDFEVTLRYEGWNPHASPLFWAQVSEPALIPNQTVQGLVGLLSVQAMGFSATFPLTNPSFVYGAGNLTTNNASLQSTSGQLSLRREGKILITTITPDGGSPLSQQNTQFSTFPLVLTIRFGTSSNKENDTVPSSVRITKLHVTGGVGADEQAFLCGGTPL